MAVCVEWYPQSNVFEDEESVNVVCWEQILALCHMLQLVAKARRARRDDRRVKETVLDKPPALQVLPHWHFPPVRQVIP